MTQPARVTRNYSWTHRAYSDVCVYCGADGPTVDHVVPWSFVQDQGRSNLVTACQICNSIASNLVFDSFDAKRAYVRTRRQQLGYAMAPDKPVVSPVADVEYEEIITDYAPAVHPVDEAIDAIRLQFIDLEALAAEEDPWTVPEMLRLRQRVDAMLLRTVKRLRDNGYTWNDIGVGLGLNAIQTHKKFAHKLGDVS